MAEKRFRILVAESTGPWRSTLVSALEEEGHQVSTTEDGGQVVDKAGGLDLIIVGCGLQKLSAFDAIYAVSDRFRDDVSRRPKMMLACQVSTDAELRALLYRRGVGGYLSPHAPVDEQISAVRDILFSDSRRNQRHRISRALTMQIGDRVLEGTTRDLAEGGLLIELSQRDIEGKPIAVGTTVALEIDTSTAFERLGWTGTLTSDGMLGGASSAEPLMLDEDRMLAVAAVVRHTTTKRRFLGDRVWVGLQFVDMSEDARAKLLALLATATAS